MCVCVCVCEGECACSGGEVAGDKVDVRTECYIVSTAML